MVGEVGQICLPWAKEDSFRAVDGKHGKLWDDAQKPFTISHKTSTEYGCRGAGRLAYLSN